MVRLRRQVGTGPNGVAALVPTTLFLPQVSTQGGPFSAYARIMTRQGTIIGEVGERSRGEAGADFVAMRKSDKFGFDTEIVTPRERIATHHADIEVSACSEPGSLVADSDRIRRAAAEAPARQSDRRDRACARGRRIRAVLPADRRHPLGPAARRGSAGPLAQARRHARAAGRVHSARGIERA